VKFLKLLPALLLSFSALPSFATESTNFTPEQTKAIQNIVRDYLINQPQVLIEASEALQKQEMAKAEANAKTQISQNADAIFADASNPVIGNPKGTITVVEFFDYQCPHCKDMAPIIDKLIAGDNNVRVVFKELPIFGENSKFASSAALAAFKLNPANYAKFHNALMAASNPLSQDKVLKIAKDSGIDVNALKKAMQNTAIEDQLQANFKLARELGIMGTPSLIVGKWVLGSKDNKVDNAIFIPGATSLEKLQQAITQVK
jgi:protein-disulfide isomerase